MAFSMGFLGLITPSLVLERSTYSGSYCLDNAGLQNRVTHVTLLAIGGLSISLLLGFKLVQPRTGDLWFLVKSHYWWPNLVLAGSLVVYQFSHSLLMCLFVFPLIQSAGYLGRSLRDTLQTLLLCGLVLATATLLLFGTMLGDSGFVSLVRTAIADHLCGGSNVWTYLCLQVLPSFLIFFKILSN